MHWCTNSGVPHYRPLIPACVYNFSENFHSMAAHKNILKVPKMSNIPIKINMPGRTSIKGEIILVSLNVNDEM